MTHFATALARPLQREMRFRREQSPYLRVLPHTRKQLPAKEKKAVFKHFVVAGALSLGLLAVESGPSQSGINIDIDSGRISCRQGARIVSNAGFRRVRPLDSTVGNTLIAASAVTICSKSPSERGTVALRMLIGSAEVVAVATATMTTATIEKHLLDNTLSNLLTRYQSGTIRVPDWFPSSLRMSDAAAYPLAQ